ncbi:MAG: ATP-binding protein [Fibrobacter sp.]|nr:ATP-binding protein [Fibrobacter sp.]
MDESLKKMLDYLRLQQLAKHWDSWLALANKGNYSHVKLLNYVIEQEYNHKRDNAKTMRIARAKIPEKFIIETFPFEQQPNFDKNKIINIYDSFDYMEKKRDIIWIGTTGVGKTGLATSFLIQAINSGYNGRFITFPELVELLYKSVADHSEATVLKTFASYDCLLIDELGYIEVEPLQVGLFFTLMSKRHKHKTTLITSNLGFKQWNTFLKNDHLTAALIDRLTENSYVVNMRKCTSLRKQLDDPSELAAEKES